MQWWCAAQDVAWSWNWTPYPGVWLFIAALAGVYVALHRRFEPGDPSFGPGARRAFAGAGLILLWAALDWPIGALGSGYLASVHMVQFLLIAVTAPPLLLLGLPRGALERFATLSGVGRVVRAMGYPIVSLATFTAILGFTHWPMVVDRLMAGQAGSFLLDMLWLLSGLIFWWPVAVALPRREWQQEPFKMGYLIAATLVNTGVFAFLTFSQVPVYATFELAPPVGLLSTRDDQLIAGLLMKLGGAAVLWTSITILFFRWVGRSDREDRAQAAVVAVVAVLALGGCAASATEVVGPVVIGEPVMGDRAALYLTARAGAQDDRLLAVEVDGVGAVSLHHTRQADGMMRMEAAEGGIPLSAGETLRLRPGGDHAMLEQFERPLVVGDSVRVTVRFQTVEAKRWARVVALADLEAALGNRP
jgi:putative membrane protein